MNNIGLSRALTQMRANDFQTTYISIGSPIHSTKLFVLVNDNIFPAITSKVSSLAGRFKFFGGRRDWPSVGWSTTCAKSAFRYITICFVTVPGNR
jgi:hypothetical protein